MERYETYVDSGTEWIGAMPSAWTCANLGSIAKQRKNLNKEGEVETVLSLSYGNVKRRAMDNTGLLPESFNTYNIIEDGDVVLRLTDLQNDQRSLRVGLCHERGIITSAYTTLAPQSIDSRYLFYSLAVFDYWKGFYGLAGGVRQSLTFDGIRNLRFPLPSQKEQQAIADYLDDKTAEIDTLVEECEREVELLREYRKAVISEAVTKGLDPDAPRKDSGIEWIGEIPEGWEVVGFKTYLTSIIDYRGRTPEKVDEGVFLITGRNIKQGRVHYELSQEYMRPEDFDTIMSRGRLQIGNVLFTMEAPLGEVALIDRDDCAAAQRIVQLCCKEDELYGAFLVYWIMSDEFQSDLQTYATGSTASGIKASKLGMLRLIHPPMKTQHDIVDYLDAKTTEIDHLIDAKQSMADKLREYRRSLISETVTGKFRVPEVQ